MSLLKRALRRCFGSSYLPSKRNLTTLPNDLFDYTSGRFLYNEEIRLAERRLRFDVEALLHEICHTTGRQRSDLKSFRKLDEGGFNRIFEATFTDGQSTLARLPYPSTLPRHYATASEVATLDLLRQEGLPVPHVLGYSSHDSNPVGSEYIILEKLPGTCLGHRWFDLEPKDRVEILRQVVSLEARWLRLSFPASGSVYYKKDLKNDIPSVELPYHSGRFVVGPSAAEAWWDQGRGRLSSDRGPWSDFMSCFQAPAKREAVFCRQRGKPRHHVERHLRQLHNFELRQPSEYLETLQDFLKIAPFLEIPASHPFSRPILRHPDLSPNNILVSDSNTVTGVIDWQHSVVLPLALHADIPSQFQNWGDPVSEAMTKPETKLPENIDSMDAREQENVRDEVRRRLGHFYYVALTLRSTPDLYSAIRDTNTRHLRTLYERTNVPWEGDYTSLKYALIQIVDNWPFSLRGDLPTKLGPQALSNTANASPVCPVHYSNQEKAACVKLHFEERDCLNDVDEMREYLGIDAMGWLPEDRLSTSKEIRADIKQKMLMAAETEMDKLAIRDHFQFDDHDEE